MINKERYRNDDANDAFLYCEIRCGETVKPLGYV